MGVDFNFRYAGPENKGRASFRVAIRNALVRISGREQPYVLENISASGLAFHAAGTEFRVGEGFVADITGRKRNFIDGLKLEVVRVNREDGVVACRMVDLDSDSEALIDKLVLEVQKRELARKRAEV